MQVILDFRKSWLIVPGDWGIKFRLGCFVLIVGGGCLLWVVVAIGDDGGMVMRQVIVVSSGGWERVLRVIDDAQIEHWQMLTLNLGSISKQDSIWPCSGCHSFWAIPGTILA